MASVSLRQRGRRFLTASLAPLIILLLSWLLIGPLWSQPGLPNSADGILHLHRSAAVARSWAAGVLWPRWFPDVYQGLGAPTFHYYSPLFYLLVAPLHLLGLALDLSAKLVISIFFVVSGVATWAWLRRLLGPVAGLAGAALYLSQPLFFREYYFQGDYPQLLALLLLPVLFWAFTALFLDGSWLNWLAAPLSLALLVLAHNITALLGATMLVLYSLALLLWRPGRSRWLRLAAGGLWALGLSAFFWLPALADSSLVRVQHLQVGFFHYSQYFVSWRDLLAAPPVLDSRAANPPFPQMLGWAAWLVVLGGALAVIISFVRRSGRTTCRFWAAAGLVLVALCIFLTRPWSAFFWENLPFLALVEFPSRWLGPTALGVALVAGALVANWSEHGSTLFLAGLILAVGLSSSVFLFPAQPFRAIDDLPPSRTQTYERRSQAWGLTSGNEFLPRWAAPPQPYAGGLAQEQYVPAGAKWSWETPHRARLTAASGSVLPAGPLVLPVHYFPAWEATADHASLSIEPTAEGLVGLELAQPAQEVILQWRGTLWQKVGQGISLCFLLGWAVWAGLAARRHTTEEGSPYIERCLRGYQWLAPSALLVFLILGRGAIQSLDLGWFQRSSPPGEVRSVANPVHMDLGAEGQSAVTLLGWELLSGTPQPGSQLIVRLYWQRQERIAEGLHSVAFLYSPSLQHSWAGVQNYNPGRIPTSNWSRALYYVDDLEMALPADLAPATYTLAIGMVNAEGERLTVPDTVDDLVFLDEVTVEPLKAGRGQPLQAQVVTPALFGESLWLQGYDLLPDPGGPVLRLYWQVERTPPADWVTFVHLVDGKGQLVAQFDGPPLDGLLPTSQWPARSLMIDRHKIVLPEDLPPGQYRFLVGLYERDTNQRLKVKPEAGEQEHFADDALIVPLDVPH
jgi:hypothetical protein